MLDRVSTPDASAVVDSASKVAAAAAFLHAAVSTELPSLSPVQQKAVAQIAGENLRGALDDLNMRLPGIRARAQALSVEAMLSEYDAALPAGSGDGETLRALVPVAIVAEGILARAPEVPAEAWDQLDERLTALELTQPVLHAELATQIEGWLKSAETELPRETPPG